MITHPSSSSLLLRDPCSIFTRDPAYFAMAATGQGAAGRWRHDDLHFASNCLTKLEAADSVHVRSRSRLQPYVDLLTNTPCTQYEAKDPRVMGGLSMLVEDYAMRLLQLADDDNAVGAGMNYPLFRLVREYDWVYQDLHLGITKAMLWLAEEAFSGVDLWSAVFTAVFAVMLVVGIVQVGGRGGGRGGRGGNRRLGPELPCCESGGSRIARNCLLSVSSEKAPSPFSSVFPFPPSPTLEAG
jgi:hypothetical protein